MKTENKKTALKNRQSGRPSRSEVSDEGNTKERILETGLKIFGERGFDGAKIQDIATMSDANLSLISYHFGGKEGLFAACLKRATTVGVDAARRILTAPQTREELLIRWRLFLETLVAYQVEQATSAQFISRQSLDPDPSRCALFKEMSQGICSLIEDFFKAALKKKLLKAGTDTSLISGFLFNSVVASFRKESVLGITYEREITDPKFRTDIVEMFSGPMFVGFLA